MHPCTTPCFNYKIAFLISKLYSSTAWPFYQNLIMIMIIIIILYLLLLHMLHTFSKMLTHASMKKLQFSHENTNYNKHI